MLNAKGAARGARACAVVVATLGLASATAGGRELVSWDGTPGVEGLWTTPANWTADQLPADDDDAVISNGGIARIDSAVTTGSVGVAADTGSAGTLRISGGTLTTTLSDFRVGGSGWDDADGTLEQTGGDIVMNAGNLVLGFGSMSGTGNPSTGAYTLSAGTVTLNSGTSIVAVGNRGNGNLTQTGGTLYARGSTVNPGASVIQLGRNTSTRPGQGTYTLSGGLAAAANLRFGETATTGSGVPTNTFNLQGAGVLRTGTISVRNTAAANSFNFTGGTLTATTVNLPTLANDGGTLSPATLAFTGTGTVDDVLVDAVGTTTINGSYTQGAAGTLAVDLAGASDFDRVTVNGAASVNGFISVSLLDGFDPAPGQTFDVLTATGGVLGAPAVQGNTASGRSFTASNDGTVLRLTVVPEPGVASLLALAAVGLLARRRPANGDCPTDPD